VNPLRVRQTLELETENVSARAGDDLASFFFLTRPEPFDPTQVQSGQLASLRNSM
jgi:hypothetical protein